MGDVSLTNQEQQDDDEFNDQEMHVFLPKG